MEEIKNSQILKRTLGFFPALTTVMGTVIGAGVFFKAQAVASTTGSTSLHMLVWLLGGIISVCAGLTGAELAAAIPKTGGMIKYIEHAYGKLWGFLLGWAEVIIYVPANIAALAVIFGTQFVNLFGMNRGGIVPVAIIAAVSITLINFLGSKAAGNFQSVTLVAKLIPLALIVIFGLLQEGAVTVSLFPITAGEHTSLVTALGAGLLATMFAYDGWIHVGNISGELKNPKKDLPRAIAFGIIGITAVYLLINFVYLRTLPVSEIGATDFIPSMVAEKIFPGIGSKFVTIGILISVYGTINGYVMTGMRLPYVMAKEKRLPFWRTWRKLSSAKIPTAAGILQLVIAVIMLGISSVSENAFNLLSDMLVFVIWIFYTLIFIAVILLRKKEPELDRPYKVPLYPIIPMIAILGGMFILIMTLINSFMIAAIGIGVTLVGIPVFFYMDKN